MIYWIIGIICFAAGWILHGYNNRANDGDKYNGI